MKTHLVIAFCLLAGPASAQALGSVLCDGSMKKINAEMKATEMRVQQLEHAPAPEKCSAMRVHLIMLQRADEVFGRCLAGPPRDEKLAPIKSSAAYLGTYVAENCGG